MRAPIRIAAIAAFLLRAAFVLAPAWCQAEFALADLFVNGDRRGTIQLELGPDGQALLLSDKLRSMLEGVADSSILEALAGKPRLVGEEELRALGVGLSFDKQSLSLSMRVDAASMSPQAIDLVKAPQPRKSELLVENASIAATIGVSLDYEPSNGWKTDGSDSFNYNAGLDLTPSLRAFGIVLEGDARLGYGPYGYSWSLDSAQAVKDFPDAGARLRAGIVYANAVSFQASQQLYGVTFARDESLPGAARERVSLDEQFIVRQEADVTVLVNGVVTKQTRLAPGNYRFSDLSLSSGLNEITVVIKEEGEPPRTVKIGIPFDSSLLGPGKVDYAISLGTTNLDGPEPYGAFHLSVGAGRYLQVGMNAEAGSSSALGGVSALAATGLGNLGLEGAFSTSYPGVSPAQGPAYAARMYWRLSRPDRCYLPLLGAAAEYRAPCFATPGFDASPQASSLSLSGQIGESLPGDSGSASLWPWDLHGRRRLDARCRHIAAGGDSRDPRKDRRGNPVDEPVLLGRRGQRGRLHRPRQGRPRLDQRLRPRSRERGPRSEPGVVRDWKGRPRRAFGLGPLRRGRRRRD
jgi:hypothetical protein